MMRLSSTDDLLMLKETVEVECKLAAGKHGRGQLPEDFWATYSAFANTRGGTIVLGLAEKDREFILNGLIEAEKVKSDLFNQLENRQKISANLLKEDDVYISNIDGKSIIIVEVPEANRRQKPVYTNNNPLTGTYKRSNDGDRKCDVTSAKRMLAEQVEETRDIRVLRNFDLSDLSPESVKTYRQLLRTARPDHPFLEKDDLYMLRRINAWKRDRDAGFDGLTVAGLLMFGRYETIVEEFPHYFLDYQERAHARADSRWIDRVTPDGTWSGNIFDFYRRIYRKLTLDLKVPFKIKGGQRQSETPVHVALREALVNCLVHADYSGRASIAVVKRPDMFGFRNPGLMRVSVAQALAGGESDGRNKTLQQMFLLIGAGERAGSGVPKIHKGWTDQHWRPPALYEREEPSDQTLLELRMADLLPAETVDFLREKFGAAFDELPPDHRLTLATAATEQTISHGRMSTVCEQHPVDLTRMLQSLVQGGFLLQDGRGRGSVYHLPGSEPPDPDAVFSQPSPTSEKSPSAQAHGSDLSPQGVDLGGKGPNLASSAPHVSSASLPVDEGDGRRVADLQHPLLDDFESLQEPLKAKLRAIVGQSGGSGKVPLLLTRKIVRELCQDRFLTLRVLSQLLNRDAAYLRMRVLNPMVADGSLRRAFPQKLHDPRQAYTAAARAPSD